MVVQVKSWGNSQAVRLPKDLLEKCNFESEVQE